MNQKIKKVRGQKRKLTTLLKNIDSFTPFTETAEKYEHFHVPSDRFINYSRNTIKKQFLQKWLHTAEKYITEIPKNLNFCTVVVCVFEKDLWNSQIIIFYDKKYYDNFFKRDTEDEKWELIQNYHSLVKKLDIQHNLKESCYKQFFSNTFTDTICFYKI